MAIPTLLVKPVLILFPHVVGDGEAIGNQALGADRFPLGGSGLMKTPGVREQTETA
jgi:hypothetical protein